MHRWARSTHRPDGHISAAGRYYAGEFTHLYNGNRYRMVAAYNGGRRVGRALEKGRPIPEETRNYVPRVLALLATLTTKAPSTGWLPPQDPSGQLYDLPMPAGRR